MTDLFIHLVAYQLVTLSGTGVSVLDEGPVSLFTIFWCFVTPLLNAPKKTRKKAEVPLFTIFGVQWHRF